MKQLKRQKIWIKRQLTLLKDVYTGHVFRFAASDNGECKFNFEVALTQEIKPSETLENKLYNIGFAARKINSYVMLPGEILSFWRIVGNPERHLKQSRSITRGEITTEIGGGICQVSGIIYHIGLMAGLEILERHNHSIDIYNDDTRFTPLGTDATVVFGYKDLRLRNGFAFPVKFDFEILNNQLSVRLLSTNPIKLAQLFYEISETGNSTDASIRNGDGKLISRSVYKKQTHR